MKKVVILVLMMAVAPLLWSADPVRLALVVGNAAYAGDALLKNPVNDATDVATTLKKIGWTVTLVTDVDRRSFNRALAGFRDSLASQEGADALFYYAGHGMQVDGTNYLLPVKTEFESSDDVRNDAVNIQAVSEAIRAGNAGVSVVILDACRDNPFARASSRSQGATRGLSVVSSGGGSSGSVLMFSTSPGDVAADGKGRNGIFTAALLKHLGAGVKVEDLFKKVTAEVRAQTKGAQSPWINASLTTDFYLGPTPAPSIGSGPARSPGVPEGYAVLRLHSDPPGILVSVDGAEPLATPFAVTLTPGAHSFEPQESGAEADRWYIYQAEPKQWISLAEGTDTTIPLKPQIAASAALTLKLVPEGKTVLVDGEVVGTTPLWTSLRLPPGRRTVALLEEGKPAVSQQMVLYPEEKSDWVWGKSPGQAIVLQRKTIDLGKLDSWNGVEPVVQASGLTLRGNPRYGIRTGYVCRDEQYLYWRVDFNELNPLYDPPSGYSGQLDLCLNTSLPPSGHAWKLITLGVGVKARQTSPAAGINEPGQWVDLGGSHLEYRSMKASLVGRFPMSIVASYLDRVRPLNFDLYTGVSSTTPQVYIDFSR